VKQASMNKEWET